MLKLNNSDTTFSHIATFIMGLLTLCAICAAVMLAYLIAPTPTFYLMLIIAGVIGSAVLTSLTYIIGSIIRTIFKF